MSMARLVITAVTIEGRSKSEVARDYGVSRVWVQKLLHRFDAEGEAAFEPRSRRPHASPQAVNADTEDAIIRLRKELSKQGLDAGAETIAAHLARQAPPGGGRPAIPAVSTIWRILSRRGFVRPQPQKRPRSSWKSFCAEQPNERWQADITHWRLADGSEISILNIVDDHSRLCLGSHARRNTTGSDVVASFRKAFTRWGIPAKVLSDIQAWWCPEIPGLSGRRCEDGRVRHPCIVVASPSGALGDSLPVDHVGVRGLLPETGHPVRNLATAPNSPRIPVSECLVRTGLVSVGAVGGS